MAQKDKAIIKTTAADREMARAAIVGEEHHALDTRVARAIAAARAEEREACAKDAITKEEIEQARQNELGKLTEESSLEALRERYRNKYGAHEALHTAWIFTESVDKYLVKHPIVVLDPSAFCLALSAETLLADLYQRIGQIECEIDDVDQNDKS